MRDHCLKFGAPPIMGNQNFVEHKFLMFLEGFREEGTAVPGLEG